jgi:SRSO17 transposase
MFIPELWFNEADADKRAATAMPPTLSLQPKPEIARALLRQALARGSVPARWLAADACYGASPAFRDGVAARSYVTAIACATLLWQRQVALRVPCSRGKGRKPTKLRRKTPSQARARVDELAKRLPQRACQPTRCCRRRSGNLAAGSRNVRHRVAGGSGAGHVHLVGWLV